MWACAYVRACVCACVCSAASSRSQIVDTGVRECAKASGFLSRVSAVFALAPAGAWRCLSGRGTACSSSSRRRRLCNVLLTFLRREIWQGDLSGNAMYQTAIVKTHMRASSYCCGLLLGWFVHRFQADERTVSQVTGGSSRGGHQGHQGQRHRAPKGASGVSTETGSGKGHGKGRHEVA